VIESFVDLSYRGLSLGRRIKLTQVRPSSGYLEHPTPMPVGTAIAISTDDGIALDAVVTHVHEQVGGSDRVPGMTVKPALADQKLTAWWAERVTLAEQEPPRRLERSRSVTVRPRTHTVPAPPPAGAIEDPAGTRTTSVMDVVDQDQLAQLTRPQDETLTGGAGDHPVIDDGKPTTVMAAVDPSELGLSSSGSMPADAVEEEEDEGDASDPGAPEGAGTEGDDKTPKGSVKRRKKRR